jgi:3-mercaptopyruvate sulfurtransferase SseA
MSLRFLRPWSLSLVLAGVAAAAATGGQAVPGTTPAAPPVPVTQADAPRTTVAELKALLEKKQAVVVDVRARDAYAAGHIEGALSIPASEMEARLKELPRDKAVVAYCT